MSTENYSLLRDAYAIIDGIPEDRFDLRQWWSSRPSCGTVATVVGWLALHPQMQALGLHPDEAGAPKLNGFTDGYQSLAYLFGLTYGEALLLFTGGIHAKDKMRFRGLPNHKELWLYRVREFLKSKGEPCAL